MKKIIITGSSGLIGTKLTQFCRGKYEVVPFDLSGATPVDITSETSLEQALAPHHDAVGVIHLAAYTDVNGAFAQTGDKNGLAWQVNVAGTANLARKCAQRNLYLIHLSTAYVFAGDKSAAYTETDAPRPIEWYGQTKYEAEKAVGASAGEGVILRIDQPFSRTSFSKIDTLHRIIQGLQAGTLYPQFTNHYFGPTYIEDLCLIIDWCLRVKPQGLYHASSGEQWSDFDFAQEVQEILALPGEVKPGDLDAYLKTLNRPYQRNTALDNTKLIKELDFKLKTIREAIGETQLEKG